MSVTTARELYKIANLAIDLGYQDFGLALLEHLLKHLPSHLAGRCLLAERCVVRGRWTEAEEHFDFVLGLDPVNLPALRGRGQVDLSQGGAAPDSEFLAKAWELYPYDVTTRELLGQQPDEVSPLTQARILTACARHQDAVPYYEAAFERALERPSEQPLAALLLGQALWTAGRSERARSLLETLIEEQRTWVRPRLILAHIALEAREDALGVALLHDARALDPSSLVAEQLFAGDQRYQSWVLESLEVPTLDTELTDSAPGVLGPVFGAREPGQAVVGKDVTAEEWRLSPAMKSASSKGSTGVGPVEVLHKLDQEALSASVPDQETLVRLILSSRRRLTDRYGDTGYRALDARISELREAAAESTGHEVIKIYVDDEESLEPYGLDSVNASDPQRVSQLIEQLESRLSADSRKLRSLLIVGGDSVIPFHRLPNTTDDEDAEVLSDWPYAAGVNGLLLARFSVGRIPGGPSSDPETLLKLVDNAISHHSAGWADLSASESRAWLGPMRRLFGSKQESLTSIGYSAEIWAEASRAVFQVIGDERNLQLSPPSTDYDFLSTNEKMPTLGYFNLHGFRGSPYWYGHGESEHGSPLLPIALTPLAISWTDAEAALIYTEACYGADLQSDGGSIALNFLSSGAMGFIGSTVMSYGSLAPPVSGADLLGRYVWEGVLGGLPVGCALRRARSLFTEAAAAEQGYLDGEDQKTLLSFVLYGDPALSLPTGSALPDLNADADVACPPLACCWKMPDSESLAVSQDVEQKVQHSFPFLKMTEVRAHHLVFCHSGLSHEKCGTHPCSDSPKSTTPFSGFVVTSQQNDVSKGGARLRRLVKVTVNAEGDVTKVVVSRGGTCVAGGSRRP